jgi:hypothetical protein
MRHGIASVLGHVGGTAKPHRRLRWLHRLVDHAEQLGRERVEVELLTQPGGERLDGLGGVVAAAVEAPVDQVLDAASQRPKQGSH